MVRAILALSAASVLFAGQAYAADAAVRLASVSGDVKVSHDGKFATAKPGVLKAGDRVVASKGEATVTYADGCVVTVKAQSMATIGAASPCAGAPGLVTAGASSAQLGDLTPVQMVAGALAVGGFIYGVASVVDDDDDAEPVSP